MKRPAIPMRVKLDVVIRQEGRCACGCGQKLGSLAETEFDHVPALCFRDFDKKAGEFDPPANDPTRIFAKRVECHRQKTSGTKATSAGSDIHMQAKIDRLTGRTKAKAKRSWPKQVMPGGRDSAWKKPMHGGAVRRDKEHA